MDATNQEERERIRDVGVIMHVDNTINAIQLNMQESFIKCDTLKIYGDPLEVLMPSLPLKADKSWLKRLELKITKIGRRRDELNLGILLRQLRFLKEFCFDDPYGMYCKTAWFLEQQKTMEDDYLLNNLTYLKLNLANCSSFCLKSLFAEVPYLDELESYGPYKMNRSKLIYFNKYFGLYLDVKSKEGECFRAVVKTFCKDILLHKQTVASTSYLPKRVKLSLLDCYDSNGSSRQQIQGSDIEPATIDTVESRIDKEASSTEVGSKQVSQNAFEKYDSNNGGQLQGDETGIYVDIRDTNAVALHNVDHVTAKSQDETFEAAMFDFHDDEEIIAKKNADVNSTVEFSDNGIESSPNLTGKPDEDIIAWDDLVLEEDHEMIGTVENQITVSDMEID